MDERKVTILIGPDFHHVDLARAAVAGLCRDFFPANDGWVMDFCLAVTESLNNAVEHGKGRQIEVEVALGSKGISVRIATEGDRFDSTAHVLMPEENKDGELPEGGFGLALIQAFTDELLYEYRDGRNFLTLRKFLINEKV